VAVSVARSKRQATTSRQVAAVSIEALGASLGRAAAGADLGVRVCDFLIVVAILNETGKFVDFPIQRRGCKSLTAIAALG